MAAIYGRKMTADMSFRIIRAKLWEHGHSMEEIDSMNLEDIGDVLGYWNEKTRIEAKQAKTKKNLGKKRK